MTTFSHEAPTPFWLVWSPRGPTNPQHQHPTLESAEIEANRLAMLHTGTAFYVVEPVYRCARLAVEQTRYRRDEIPF